MSGTRSAAPRREVGASGWSPVGSAQSAPTYQEIETAYGGGSIDLGHGVVLHFSTNADGRLSGFVEDHPRARETMIGGQVQPAGSACGGAGLFDVTINNRSSRFKWRVLSWVPLTLEPSIRCRSCGHRGWVRAGRWVPA